ncbi:MAG: hypothetical protein AAF514_18540 [Verrucomicrobiota bacterium]
MLRKLNPPVTTRAEFTRWERLRDRPSLWIYGFGSALGVWLLLMGYNLLAGPCQREEKEGKRAGDQGSFTPWDPGL